jgi:hypothetical protein
MLSLVDYQLPSLITNKNIFIVYAKLKDSGI